MTLTHTQLEAAKPQDKPYRLSDGAGLQLEIRTSGAKVWLYRYRQPHTQKQTILTLGEYPSITIRQARLLIEEARALLKQGIDPNTHKQAQKQLSRGLTFKDLALEFYAQRQGAWSAANAEQVMKCFEVDIFPHIGHRVASELTTLELLQVVRTVEARGSLDKAAKVRQRINAVYVYGFDSGQLTHNPTPSSGALQLKPKGQHFNALTVQELPQFLTELSAYRSEVLRRAIQFTMLTLARSGSIRLAQWVEIDWVNACWHIPADHMKLGRAHSIPLSTQALQLLHDLKPFTGNSNLIFYTHRIHKPMSENAMLAALRHMGWGGKITMHGMRALGSSVLHEAGFNPKAIEMQLAHVERNKIAGSYNYMATYWEERITLMQWWADFLDSANAKPTKTP
ncbi:tyrosine-type recombinase/integrase [Thiofilum flexile]|uniref:tyrosine-type recombinase/integrase n=1 Tax=Thiofilum flexile TaxID=125627 RepID=UPI00035CE357|nr:integrase arm-type DNA-binding domain-containing protein [Thiofilum flexile]